MWRQQRALIRRCRIIIFNSPVSHLITLILLPGYFLGKSLLIMSGASPTTDDDDELVRDIQSSLAYFAGSTMVLVLWFTEFAIRDKALGIKKLMLSMGLGRLDYYCANSACFQLFTLPASLSLAIVTKLYPLQANVSWPEVTLLFTLFALHLDAVSSFLVSFFSSKRLSSLPILILGFLVLYIGFAPSPEEAHKSIPFLYSISPYLPVGFFITSHSISHVMTRGIFMTQIVWIILLRSFAGWFEEVCPWQTVSAVMSPCFCIGKQQDRCENIEDSMESIAITSKYFEHRAQYREVGIKISKVTKAYRGVQALSDVSFSIYKGETTLLLGHNGAGKTTLMDIILGLQNPDHGNVKVRKSPNKLSSVGVCPQLSILDDELTVRQHIELFNDIKSNISGLERDRHIKETIDDVSLGNHVSKRPGVLSGGMRRKLSLAMALVGKSDVLILDEPSSGLDPASRMFIWNAIRRFRQDRTVLLSTQHMEEADYLGDRIAIMRGGQIVCCGSSGYLNKLFGTGYRLRIECQQSRAKAILDHIQDYFDDAQPRAGLDANAPKTGANIDFELELQIKNRGDDAEMLLIKLLQDLESNSSALGVHSYGLKSSSIEDVMLMTQKYFSTPESVAANQRRISSNVDQLSSTTTERPTRSKIIRALCIKQLQVYRARWFVVLLLRILVPIIAIYKIIDGFTISKLMWQSVAPIIVIRQFVRFPAAEHVSKFKFMQLESGASVWMYWLSQLIIDSLSVALYLVYANISLRIELEATFLVPDWQLHLLVTLATLLFCLASLMFCYTVSAISKNAGVAEAYVWSLHLLSIFICGLTVVAGLQFESERLKNAGLLMSHIFLLFLPGDAYQYIRSGLDTDCYISSSPLCIPSTGLPRVPLGLVALVFQTLLYAGLLYLIEMHKLDLAWYLRPRNALSCIRRRAPPAASNVALGQVDKDVDDENERALISIKSPTVASNSLTAVKLHKSYFADIKVIQDLSFAVKKGECFGLLGVNGAGKTTTFSMLAAEALPDAGRILANGHYLDKDLHLYRSTLGYDPQSNPDLSLTAYQAFSLMARLRGVEESRIPALVESVSDLLDMSQHVTKLDSQLSGGTKRKLALGMALIGNPSILLLDEPTAGVDPLARRAVWRLLRSLRERSHTSIVVSSHAMEECETICDRISVMKDGRLRCIGSFLHLKSKFVRGCTLKVQFGMKRTDGSDLSSYSSTPQTLSGSPSNDLPLRPQPARNFSEIGVDKLADASMSELKQLLDAEIGPGNYKLTDKNVTSLTFEIADNKVKRSKLFEIMSEFRRKHPNVIYAINDLSLEDIFISLARERTARLANVKK